MRLVKLVAKWMRVVADTNIIVSGLLWRRLPRRVLDAVRGDIIELFTGELQNTQHLNRGVR